MMPIQWKQNDKKTMHVNEAENGVVYLTWPAIEKIEGVESASVNFLSARLTIEAPEEKMAAIIREAVKVCHKIEPDCRILV